MSERGKPWVDAQDAWEDYIQDRIDEGDLSHRGVAATRRRHRRSDFIAGWQFAMLQQGQSVDVDEVVR